MTPEQKAKDLINKMNVIHYLKLHGKNKDSKGLPISMYDDQIKQCALIAVDEIIKALRKGLPEVGLGKGYWYNVKQEIEKI